MRPNIPEELEELVDEVAEENGFSSNSEFIRHATRKFVFELKEDSDGN